MRALVTGGNGFVGRYLRTELRTRGYDVVVAGRVAADGPGESALALDLGDLANVRAVVDTARADVIFHLAAQAFVPTSTRDPLDTYDTNVIGTARVIEAIREKSARPRLVYIGSGEVYGAQDSNAYPLRETVAPRPATPYAASKLAGETIALASARTYGFEAVATRAFNHIGAGQSENFVVAAFAKRLAGIAAGGDPLFPVGNLTSERDFLDVRDVVRAYADLAERGEAGEIYNVCSGVPVRIQEVLRQLVMSARIGVEIREDPALMRPVDVPRFYGDNAKLVAATGWQATISLAQSLREIYAAARRTVLPA